MYRGNNKSPCRVSQHHLLANTNLESLHLKDKLKLCLIQRMFVLLLTFLCLLLYHQSHKVNKLFQSSACLLKYLKSKQFLFSQHLNLNFYVQVLQQNCLWKAVILTPWLKLTLKLFRFKLSVLMLCCCSINMSLIIQ